MVVEHGVSAEQFRALVQRIDNLDLQFDLLVKALESVLDQMGAEIAFEIDDHGSPCNVHVVGDHPEVCPEMRQLARENRIKN